MLDLGNELVVSRAVKPDAHAAGSVAGAAIDTKGAQTALLLIDIADVGAAGTVDITVTHCDTSGGTYATHTTVAQKTAVGQTIVELSKFKRYVKVNAVIGANAVDASAVLIAGNPRESKNLVA